MDNVLEKAKQIVADVFNINPAPITRTTNFIDDSGGRQY